jgi:hypothetical protein
VDPKLSDEYMLTVPLNVKLNLKVQLNDLWIACGERAPSKYFHGGAAVAQFA